MENRTADIEQILSHRTDNGADLWATPEGNLAKGCPLCTLEACYILSELGLTVEDPVLGAAAELLWRAQRPDGRFSLVPKSESVCSSSNEYASTRAFTPQARLRSSS